MMKIKTRRAMVIIQDDGSHLSSIAVSWRRWRKSPSVCLVIKTMATIMIIRMVTIINTKVTIMTTSRRT